MRKVFKVIEVNCIGFRVEENVYEEVKGKDINFERVLGLGIREKKDYFKLEMYIKR